MALCTFVLHLLIGSATRVCTDSGDWEGPNVLQCQSLDIIRVNMEVRYHNSRISNRVMEYIYLYISIFGVHIQAVAQLPPADAVIVSVSAELRANATFVSQQLVEATTTGVVSLLPLDLNTTNNVVSQVLATFLFTTTHTITILSNVFFL